MAKVREFISGCFSSKTSYGRVIRTILQALIGISGLVVTMWAIPEVQNAFSESLPNSVTMITVAVGVASAAWNFLGKLWEKIKDN